jgi:hypothetical protein
MNPDGHPQTLVASQPGNANAQKSGAWSRRDLALDEDVKELAVGIMAGPHVAELDYVGAVEVAKLLVLIDRIDADLAERGITRKKSGEPRGVVDLRRRLSAQLERWLTAFGMTPAARAALMRDVATGGLAAEIARRRAAREEAAREQ